MLSDFQKQLSQLHASLNVSPTVIIPNQVQLTLPIYDSNSINYSRLRLEAMRSRIRENGSLVYNQRRKKIQRTFRARNSRGKIKQLPLREAQKDY